MAVTPPQPRKPCPECGHSGRFLPEPSIDSYVNYYRCDDCAHVWCYDKRKPDGAHHGVTPNRTLTR